MATGESLSTILAAISGVESYHSIALAKVVLPCLSLIFKFTPYATSRSMHASAFCGAFLWNFNTRWTISPGSSGPRSKLIFSKPEWMRYRAIFMFGLLVSIALVNECCFVIDVIFGLQPASRRSLTAWDEPALTACKMGTHPEASGAFRSKTSTLISFEITSSKPNLAASDNAVTPPMFASFNMPGAVSAKSLIILMTALKAAFFKSTFLDFKFLSCNASSSGVVSLLALNASWNAAL